MYSLSTYDLGINSDGNAMNLGTIVIKGVSYIVLSRSPFQHQGKQRFELHLRRPAGRVAYVATEYENGTLSDVVRSPFYAAN